MTNLVKEPVRCVCGTVTHAVINFDVCSNPKCGFVLAEAWGCKVETVTSGRLSFVARAGGNR